MNDTMTIFDYLYSKYKITKPIRLIEFFAGYGSQALALKYLGVSFEHWKICEWAVKSIQAYKDIHFDNESAILVGLNKEKEAERLYKQGISSNYNEPMTKQKIERLSYQQIYDITANNLITHNLVNIQNVKGKDLEIVDTDKYDYILTYSFPCQDLSLAGKGKGMSDTSTRSGMLWEVERILTECKELGTLPQILLMENVPQVHGTDNVKDFNKWQLRLEELGYKNYFQDLIATNYGIPQTRNRCFMVSILGDYSYTFPKPIPLKLKLKDMLEDNVDEKYYLSDKQIKDIQNWNAYEKPLENMEKVDKTNISPTLTTRSGAYAAGMVLIKDTENYVEWEDGKNIQMNCRAWKADKIVATLNTGGETKILIKNATKKGYLEAEIGDGIDISSRMEHHRGNVQKDKIQTLTTSGGNDRGVVIGTYQYAKSDTFMQGKDRLQLGKEVSDTLQTTQKEGVVTIGNYSKSNHNASRIVDQEYSAPTVMENHGTITAIIDENNKNAKHQQDMIQDSNGNARTLVCGTHGNGGHYTKTLMNDLRIRKLTPKECFRLQGVKDEDFEKCAKNQSDSSLYHLAGDSICTSCLIAIFGELLNIDWKEKLNELLKEKGE